MGITVKDRDIVRNFYVWSRCWSCVACIIVKSTVWNYAGEERVIIVFIIVLCFLPTRFTFTAEVKWMCAICSAFTLSTVYFFTHLIEERRKCRSQVIKIPKSSCR